MKTYPLHSITLAEAKELQFRIIDCLTNRFAGHEFLTRGDLGLTPGHGKPITTEKVEQVIADVFHTEAAMLVRGAGSGAIRLGLHAILKPQDVLLVHKAPVYNTTAVSLQMLGIQTVEADYNDDEEIKGVLAGCPEIKGALIQYTRQKIDDRYDMEHVVKLIKDTRSIPVITDDNYAVMKVNRIGVQCGADLSCFSAFKLLGPEGIGVIAGRRKYIEILQKENYSGGMQVQGHEAMDVIYGLVYAPVALAIQAEVNEECLKRLNSGEIPEVKAAYIANAQSKVLLVELNENIAGRVLEEAEKLGAAPNPVGAESKYEMLPMFYRISGTFRKSNADLEKRMLRINPMRSGPDTIMRILRTAIERTKECF